MTALPSEPDNATLNRLVAEKVMGLDPECTGPLRRTEGDARYEKYYCRECGQPIAFTTEYFAVHGELPKSHRRNTPNYCEDMNAAWEAVRKFTELPETFEIASQVRLSRFAFWWEKANLWAMKPGEAAKAMCIKILDILGAVPEFS